MKIVELRQSRADSHFVNEVDGVGDRQCQPAALAAAAEAAKPAAWWRTIRSGTGGRSLSSSCASARRRRRKSLGLGTLPDGLDITSFDIGGSGSGGTSQGNRTTYTVGVPSDPMRINLAQGSVSGEPGAHPGRDVQGHPTELAGGNGWRTLTVQDAVDGDPVLLSGDVTFDELYAIADALVLP